MPASAAPNVGLNYGWSVGESGWGAGQSYNLFVSDWFLQPRVLNITNTPPGSPSLGDAYVCGTAPTGAWSGKANQIAIYYSSSWYFFPAKSGWSVYNVADGLIYQYSGSAWASLISSSSVEVKVTNTSSIPLTRYINTAISLPDYSGVSFNPAHSAGEIARAGGASSTAGGMTFNAFTASGSPSSSPINFVGYHGSTSPTAGAVTLRGYKHSGTNNRVALAASETVVEIQNATTTMLRVFGDGSLVVNDFASDGVNKLQVNGSAIISNNAKVRGGAGISLLVGSDAASNTTITDATQKNVRIAVPHYTNAEEPVALLFATIAAGASGIHIGGGSSLVNAATQINLVTAGTNTTTTGTVRFQINSAGRTLIGPTLPTDDGVNAVQINGAVTIATGNTYKVNNVSVVGARDTGWAAMTGTTNKATAYDTSTVTLPQLAGRVMALQAALTTHGLLGT